VNNVKIPSYVIQALSDQSDFNAAFYNINNPPYFNYSNIVKSGTSHTPDLNRIETRMWFYYVATQYIDFGCKLPYFSGHSKIEFLI
jgi:hypothetical protein